MEKQVRKLLYHIGETGQFRHRIILDGEIGPGSGKAMKLIVFLLFFVFITANAFSFGRKEVKNSEPLPATGPDIVSTEEQINAGTEGLTKLTGRVQIYGSEPHTFVGIADEKGTEFAVYPPEQEKILRELQGHLIEFTVIFLDAPQGYGSLFLKGGTVTPVKWEILR